MTTTELTVGIIHGTRRLLDHAEGKVSSPVDPAGLAVFRILFGVLVAFGSARFLASGFIEKLYAEPSFFFRYSHMEWVPVPSASTITVLYASFIALGVLIAVGLFTRLSFAVFTVLFAWVQLVDVTNYLNHYWLVILLGILMSLLPSSAALSLDARWFSAGRASIPWGAYALLRFQVACVYVFAAIAKVGPDWLFFGEPLGVWLPSKDELPILGPFLAVPLVPLVLSWCGFLYDATIVPLLLWRRTRVVAYVLVIVFHGLTRVFFEIGMFPFIMAVATTMFFDPAWPRRFIAATRLAPTAQPVKKPLVVLACVWCALHVAVPLRCFGIGDNVLWDEAGMRFSWRVMVREKSGSLMYRVTSKDTGREWRVSPHEYLTWRQVNEMIGQPDMILALAHHIRADFSGKGRGDVEVRADSKVTLNGRAASAFIDPTVDLAIVSDSWKRASFVLPPPTSSPPLPFR